MGDAGINTLTMEQYLALTNQAPGVVKPKIGGNVNFEIKSQFMRELREDTFSRNKNDDAYEHVERILNIVNLFKILRVTRDEVMLRVFPITLTGAAKRWVDRLSPGTINTWDLLKRHSFKGINRHLKQQSSIRRFITSSKRVMRHCTKHGKGLDTMTRQLLDSQGTIPNKTLSQALDAIQTMPDHSQKWHDGSTSGRVTNDSSDGIAMVTDTIKSDKIQAKPDKTEHKTESVEKSIVKNQQKVKPDKIEAKKNQNFKETKEEGLKLPFYKVVHKRG
nr:hypothetical protein [Tanacetum cinerariifolium]